MNCMRTSVKMLQNFGKFKKKNINSIFKNKLTDRLSGLDNNKSVAYLFAEKFPQVCNR